MYNRAVDIRFQENPALRAEQVADLREAVGWDRWLKPLRKVLERRYFSVACFTGADLVGYVHVVSDGVGDAHIQDLMVHPAYQRKGIGSKLLAMALQRIKADGIRGIGVLFDPGLTEFYKRAGFTISPGVSSITRQGPSTRTWQLIFVAWITRTVVFLWQLS